MVKKFYFLKKKGYDTLDHREIWNQSNAIIIVETSEKRAREKASGSYSYYTPRKTKKPNYLDPKETTCEILDINNYKIGSVVIEDYGDDG